MKKQLSITLLSVMLVSAALLVGCADSNPVGSASVENTTKQAITWPAFSKGANMGYKAYALLSAIRYNNLHNHYRHFSNNRSFGVALFQAGAFGRKSWRFEGWGGGIKNFNDIGDAKNRASSIYVHWCQAVFYQGVNGSGEYLHIDSRNGISEIPVVPRGWNDQIESLAFQYY